ncbi:UNVERIFIED_CONTAM: hypothetical protein GTU68_038366 [Idotea baltica]|nr:hypothetical protein [Idotea baltica]
MCTDHQWINNAIRKIEADYQRSADTHLIKLDLPSIEGIDIYLKDESTHPTGSLKHRLARSLFLYAICNGWVGPETTIIESSSGSTAVSEAYFARLLGLPFIAVMPKCTAKKKIEQIEFYGGQAHLVDRSDEIYDESRRLATELNGHYMDQFTYAERATDCKIEGIGRPRAEPSFIPGVVDEMRKIPDAASIATTHWLSDILGRKVGASTGTNMYGVLQLASEMKARGEKGSIVTLLCDSGERYLDTYFNDEWVNNNIGDLQPYAAKLEAFSQTGELV